MNHIVHAMLPAMSLGLAAGKATAADYKLNPFKLGYKGAISRNVRSEVNIHDAEYVDAAVASLTTFYARTLAP
ncbi:hypothetical protein LMG31886_22070 [Xanthomonas hydrangeae]|nr:hypothetical protein LMG31886_22070 [Xanthomonas hydrangeae]CAD7735175.1 hypothetical protein LMG31886_22070 [Xanthomonas hydrangeae]CAD7744621.1 hypothetical protein LMG31885_38160 [Xanthomonas hydrangeae]CAD7744624.1 hypothetical protein LMG31885_38160 [Xanthomonas hydrangeae]